MIAELCRCGAPTRACTFRMSNGERCQLRVCTVSGHHTKHCPRLSHEEMDAASPRPSVAGPPFASREQVAQGLRFYNDMNIEESLELADKILALYAPSVEEHLLHAEKMGEGDSPESTGTASDKPRLPAGGVLGWVVVCHADAEGECWVTEGIFPLDKRAFADSERDRQQADHDRRIDRASYPVRRFTVEPVGASPSVPPAARTESER